MVRGASTEYATMLGFVLDQIEKFGNIFVLGFLGPKVEKLLER